MVSTQPRPHPRTTPTSPRPNVTTEDLQLASEWFAPHILSYCRQNIGRTIGDGECWALASRVLEHAGKKALQQGREPTMESTGRTHGQLIFEWRVSAGYPITRESGILQHLPTTSWSIQAGDILELADGQFKATQLALTGQLGREESVRVTETVHTAVIVVVGVGDAGTHAPRTAERVPSWLRTSMSSRTWSAARFRIYRPIGTSLASSTATSNDAASLAGVCDKW